MVHHSPLNYTWYRPVRGSYLPASWQGWLLHALFLCYALGSALTAYRYAPPLVLSAFVTFALWVAGAVALTWVAAHTSEPARRQRR